ncbi:MAG: PEP-CTERM sorting domain-containing protein [Kiritimatiellae bacterium]|nr:PEP-CTERM sorting domain-containing protein [Kiritimatiellia bacterium]
MKKFITMMAVALVAISASAASIDWVVNFGRSGKFVDSTGAAMNGTIYLVLADTTFNATTAEEFESQLAAATISSDTVSAGKSSSTAVTATSDALVARSAGGEQYNFAIVVYDSANALYYMTGTNQYPTYAYDKAAGEDPTQATFASSAIAAPSQWTATYTAVPEPASAMLALAGVAMLIRRRK